MLWKFRKMVLVYLKNSVRLAEFISGGIQVEGFQYVGCLIVSG